MAKSAQAASKIERQSELEFSSYSLSDLLEIKKTIESEIRSRQSKEIDQLRAKVAETATTFGLSVEEIMGLQTNGKRITRHARGKQPPKYRGPQGEEWSGRGPAPRWMKPFLDKGKTKEDFLIR